MEDAREGREEYVWEEPGDLPAATAVRVRPSRFGSFRGQLRLTPKEGNVVPGPSTSTVRPVPESAAFPPPLREWMGGSKGYRESGLWASARRRPPPNSRLGLSLEAEVEETGRDGAWLKLPMEAKLRWAEALGETAPERLRFTRKSTLKVASGAYADMERACQIGRKGPIGAWLEAGDKVEVEGVCETDGGWEASTVRLGEENLLGIWGVVEEPSRRGQVSAGDEGRIGPFGRWTRGAEGPEGGIDSTRILFDETVVSKKGEISQVYGLATPTTKAMDQMRKRGCKHGDIVFVHRLRVFPSPSGGPYAEAYGVWTEGRAEEEAKELSRYKPDSPAHDWRREKAFPKVLWGERREEMLSEHRRGAMVAHFVARAEAFRTLPLWRGQMDRARWRQSRSLRMTFGSAADGPPRAQILPRHGSRLWVALKRRGGTALVWEAQAVWEESEPFAVTLADEAEPREEVVRALDALARVGGTRRGTQIALSPQSIFDGNDRTYQTLHEGIRILLSEEEERVWALLNHHPNLLPAFVD